MVAITGVGIDFGTTNSVVAVARADGSVESRVWPSREGPTTTFRTALTFWRQGREVAHVAGPAAVERAAQPIGDQRFVQSLKTHLASRAFADTRLYGQRFTIEALVALFLRDLMGGATAGPIVAGRPVVFAGGNPDEALAVARLQAAYAAASLADVTLAYEPLGAAYWYARDLTCEQTVLVADFGGGTSDFSVLRFSRADGRLKAAPLAHSGVGIAGDTFDYRIIDHAVAPLLGKGAHYRSFEKQLPIPAYIHAAFSQWHQLSWLKSGNTLAELHKLAAVSERGAELEALITIVEMDMGFALYRAVGALKAALSVNDRAPLRFEGYGVRIEAEVTRAAFEGWIAADLARIDDGIDAALARAGLDAAAIDAVFVTGAPPSCRPCGTFSENASRRSASTRATPSSRWRPGSPCLRPIGHRDDACACRATVLGSARFPGTSRCPRRLISLSTGAGCSAVFPSGASSPSSAWPPRSSRSDGGSLARAAAPALWCRMSRGCRSAVSSPATARRSS